MKKRYTKHSFTFTIIILTSVYLFLVFKNADVAKTAISDALLSWFYNVMPVLFPFAFGFNLIYGTGFLNRLRFKKIPKIIVCFVTLSVSSLVAGYPCSAKIISTLKDKAELNENEADFLLFCTNLPSFMYIYGTVCSVYLSCPNEALYILISTVASVIILFSMQKKPSEHIISTLETKADRDTDVFELICKSIVSASASMLNIASSMAVFGSLCSLLFYSGIFKEGVLSCILCGIIDMTSGIIKLSALNIADIYKNMLALFFVNFGGVSILLQTISAYGSADTTKSLFLFKGLQAFFASIIYLCIKYLNGSLYILLIITVLSVTAPLKDRLSVQPRQ